MIKTANIIIIFFFKDFPNKNVIQIKKKQIHIKQDGVFIDHNQNA